MSTHVARKTTVWLAFVFYIVIGFEFFYMISPFAIYFYTVYQPGLEFINDNKAISWLGSTFLPHIVNQTSSPLLNSLSTIGLIYTFGGGVVFIYGMILIYWNKFTKKSMVSNSIYTLVRHPQYGALIVCGFGMLLVWPRYIVLLSYVSMLFIYYYLARHEEQECLCKYGERYQVYIESTPMFFPLPFRLPDVLNMIPGKGYKRGLRLGLIYIVSVSVSVLLASGIRSWSLDNLYSTYHDHSATISTTKLDIEQIEQILSIALDDQQVRKKLAVELQTTKYINYITPIDWSASEIPMHQIENFDHFSYQPKKDRNQHKVIITKSIPDTDKEILGKQIVLHSKDRIPVVEVIVNTDENRVEQILEPVSADTLANVPLPVF